jgi:hypothetical protein
LSGFDENFNRWSLPICLVKKNCICQSGLLCILEVWMNFYDCMYIICICLCNIFSTSPMKSIQVDLSKVIYIIVSLWTMNLLWEICWKYVWAWRMYNGCCKWTYFCYWSFLPRHCPWCLLFRNLSFWWAPETNISGPKSCCETKYRLDGSYNAAPPPPPKHVPKTKTSKLYAIKTKFLYYRYRDYISFSLSWLNYSKKHHCERSFWSEKQFLQDITCSLCRYLHVHWCDTDNFWTG